MAVSESKKRLLNKRREAGLCVQCGADAKGKSRCPTCAAKVATKRKERQAAKKAAGICTQCKNKAKSGCTMCQSCIDKSSQCALNRYYKNKEAGVCRYCGKETGGKARCSDCVTANKGNLQRHYKRTVTAGKCPQCRKPKPTDGLTLCATCRGYHRDKAKERQTARKQQVQDHYGNKCAKCSEDNPILLQVDHINGDGAAHRQEIGRGGLYPWLIKNGFPDGFQLLCANCNTLKAQTTDKDA